MDGMRWTKSLSHNAKKKKNCTQASISDLFGAEGRRLSLSHWHDRLTREFTEDNKEFLSSSLLARHDEALSKRLTHLRFLAFVLHLELAQRRLGVMVRFSYDNCYIIIIWGRNAL